MAKLKAKELKTLSESELQDKATNLQKEYFQLRLEAKMAKLENLLKLRQVRKDLARVLTVLREKELGK